MSIAAQAKPFDLNTEMRKFIGRPTLGPKDVILDPADHRTISATMASD
jgi:hypothetical protein